MLLESVLAVWLATLGNLPLWRAVMALPETQRPAGWFGVLVLVLLLTVSLVVVLGVLMGVLSHRPARRLAGLALLGMSALASHFMASFGVVIDPGMLANVFHTDALEVRGLLGWPIVFALIAGVVLPGWFWWRTPVRPVPWGRLAGQRAALVLLGSLVFGLLMWVGFQDLSALMRNHKPLRYMINPYNSAYAVVRQGMSETRRAAQPLIAIGTDAHAATVARDPGQAPLVLMVVGETARAANFGLGGYARDTTPRLREVAARGGLVYFSHVQSCGTSTQVSVPCMFSRLGRRGLDAPPEENLLDLLQRAGLGVFWLDNQAGCKGVCDRVPHASARALASADACAGEDCPDALLVPSLREVVSRLVPQHAGAGSLVVLHQMGNHGPAYHLRSLPPRKAFLPECQTNALSSCDRSSIVNAYDNAIRETDSVLADLVAWLEQQPRPTALLYVSDHGESLGENGIYLHGMPWALAPDEQKQVPMLLWTSPSMRQRLGLQRECLDRLADRPWTHDNLFHTVGRLMQVESSAIEPGKDLLSECRPR